MWKGMPYCATRKQYWKLCTFLQPFLQPFLHLERMFFSMCEIQKFILLCPNLHISLLSIPTSHFPAPFQGSVRWNGILTRSKLWHQLLLQLLHSTPWSELSADLIASHSFTVGSHWSESLGILLDLPFFSALPLNKYKSTCWTFYSVVKYYLAQSALKWPISEFLLHGKIWLDEAQNLGLAYRAWFGPKSQNHPKKKPLGWFKNPLLKSFLLWF